MVGIAKQRGNHLAFETIAGMQMELRRTQEAAAKRKRRGGEMQSLKASIENREPANGGAVGHFAFARKGLLIQNLAGPRCGQTSEAFEMVTVSDSDEIREVVVQVGPDGRPRSKGRDGGDGGGHEVAEHGERERGAAFEFGAGGGMELEGRQGKREAARAGENQAAGGRLSSEMGDKLRRAMQVVDERGAAEAREETAWILTGADAEGWIVEREVGVGRELAAQE